ncbi:unnamed protein product [Rotaria magnacalcarata]
MTLFRREIIRTQLIIMFIFVAATNVDGRPGGRGKIVRIRLSSRNLIKNKFHLKNIYRQSPILHQSNNHILIRKATRSASALLVGTLALRSYVSNNHKEFSQSRYTLTNGTGSRCVNRENFSNFIFNEFRCPLLPIFPRNNHYCCGPSQRQYCCSFWERRQAMKNTNLSKQFNFLLTIAFLIFSLADGKGFAGGRGGSGFKGGSKGSGTFAGASSYNRPNSYKPNIVQTHGGGSFKGKAISFAAGAASGIAAYSLMKSMSSSFHSRPGGNYEPGYGVGDTCVNNEEMNGTTFGQFRCPLNGFPYEAKSCCGEHEKQFCCIPERSSRLVTKASSFGWIILFIVFVLVTLLLCIRYRRHRKKEIVTIPTESRLTNENSYGVPSRNPIGNFNPYVKQPISPY